MKVILALFAGALLSSVSSQGFSPYRQVSSEGDIFGGGYEADEKFA